MAYAWQFDVVGQFQAAFVSGLAVTLALSAATIVLATVVGIALAVLRLYAPHSGVRWVVGAWVELFRAIPILVLLVWTFYALPLLSGIRLDGFWTAVSCLVLVSSAFVAEIVRAGLQAVPKGQIEAARVLGYSRWQAVRHIVLPQALQRNLPALVGEYAATVKNTTLATIIGVNELLHVVADASSLSYRPVELYTALGLLFLAVLLPLSLLSKRLEKKHAPVAFGNG